MRLKTSFLCQPGEGGSRRTKCFSPGHWIHGLLKLKNLKPLISLPSTNPLMNFFTVTLDQSSYRNPALYQVFTLRASKQFLQACALKTGLGIAVALLTLSVQAEQAKQADLPAAAVSSASQTEISAPPPPRYTDSDLARAFGFMDGNRDGQVSRQEASGFRGVAKNFDRADTNHDGFLSREEFDAAMNYVKPK